jgi:Glycosyl hydrolase family 57
MAIAFTFVHHANQYLITEGYDNRHGLREAVGSIKSKSGFTWILELHRRYKIPANLHLSGTLLEAIAWHQPGFLLWVRELFEAGLIGLVGSCYAQNVMRFFSYEHNLKQLNEELLLYKIHLGIDPELVKVFWPPERVWDTPRMAPVLKDSRLLNHGYEYILLDDRVLLPVNGSCSQRKIYDSKPRRDVELYQACTVQDGHGLIALPIASHLRLNIPPTSQSQFNELRDHCRWLTTLDGDSSQSALIAVYGDDMEKAAGLGAWNKDGPKQFEAVLRWISETPSIRPLRICDWAAVSTPADPRPIDIGTFFELANHFAAGEGYEKWFFDPQWDRFRECFSWTERRVQQFSLSGADPALIDLAEKHLIASSWESAWHTPPEGPFGNPDCYGQPSPWIQALGSHSRHAAVIGEAAHWATHHDQQAHAKLYDIDADGEDELVLKNDKLFAVISPRWGGRLVALFNLEGRPGNMVIGNPSDDWNWMQELNRFMEVPPNHPGALTDLGFEHDAYQACTCCADGTSVDVELQNIEVQSTARGLTKRMHLSHGEGRLEVCYALPESVEAISVDFALSPDYLNLLRYGRAVLVPFEEGRSRGWSANSTAVWVREEEGGPLSWSRPFPDEAGHKASLRISTFNRKFTISIGVSRIW